MSSLARRALTVGVPRCRLVAATTCRASPLCTKPTSEADTIYEKGLERLDEGRLSQAIDHFAEAASLGSPGGNFHLGLAYDGLLGRDAADELPVDVDAAAAARCYERAAKEGHEMAMLNLSLCYKTGDGVEPDISTAWKWLSLAAAAGNERALFNAAVALDPLHPPYGTPGSDMISKDMEAALHFYRKAVDLGHEKAKVNLGVALYTGTGCEKDPETAEALWKEAHEAGVSQAGFCLRNMDKQGKMEPMFREE